MLAISAAVTGKPSSGMPRLTGIWSSRRLPVLWWRKLQRQLVVGGWERTVSSQTITYARLANPKYPPTYVRAFRCCSRCINVSGQQMRAPRGHQTSRASPLRLPFQNPPHAPQLHAKPRSTSVGASATSTIHSFASRANFPGETPMSLTTDGRCPQPRGVLSRDALLPTKRDPRMDRTHRETPLPQNSASATGRPIRPTKSVCKLCQVR